MRIVSAELFELTLPLVEPFLISGGAITERRSLVIALHDAEGHLGYGESPPFELPFYSEETLASATDLVRRGPPPPPGRPEVRAPGKPPAGRRARGPREPAAPPGAGDAAPGP